MDVLKKNLLLFLYHHNPFLFVSPPLSSLSVLIYLSCCVYLSQKQEAHFYDIKKKKLENFVYFTFFELLNVLLKVSLPVYFYADSIRSYLARCFRWVLSFGRTGVALSLSQLLEESVFLSFADTIWKELGDGHRGAEQAIYMLMFFVWIVGKITLCSSVHHCSWTFVSCIITVLYNSISFLNVFIIEIKYYHCKLMG